MTTTAKLSSVAIRPWNLCCLAAVLALAFGAPALAQPEIDWWTVDGGGGISTGGVYEVRGTAGQPDAGGASGGVFDLESGFWYADHPAVPVELMRFEISASSSERSYRVAAAARAARSARERACRLEDEPAAEAQRRQDTPAASDRSLAAGPR